VPDTSLRDVRAFWERNPVASAAIPSAPGTPEFFEHFDHLREELEPFGFSNRIHEYGAFAGGRVLDVGCGNGYVLSKYARGGAEVVGVDLTETGVGLSRRRFELSALTGSFLVGSAEDLPLASDSFDCVCSMGVLHHTPDTPRAFGELRRVLRPGGLLVVMLYHRNSAVYRRLQLRSRLQHRPVQELVNEVDGVGNPKGDVYTRAEMRALLSEFDDVRCSVAYLRGLPIRGHHFPPRALLRPFASIWGWNLYAKARKPNTK
jgi:SAM-dependent methyltransferase